LKYYAKNGGEFLEPVIETQIKEFAEKNIFIFTVLVQVEKELLWKRICDRLKREPVRLQYNEGSREFFEKTYDWYRSHPWDFVLQNESAITPDFSCTVKQRLMDCFLLFATAKKYVDVCKDHGLFCEMDKNNKVT
jgi:hypothetical protein